MKRRDVHYESPSEIETGEGRKPVKKSRPQESAAGIPAVVSTLSYLAREPGIVRGAKTLLRANQEGGVDCMSCAWPDPEHRSLFEFCENGAKALADETTQKRVEPVFFEKHSVEDLSRKSDFWLNNQGRITQPLYLSSDQSHYRPISWDDAFDMVAQRIREASDPQRLVFYTSGRASNEAAFLYGTLARLAGTNNLPDCSNMCHESSGSALTATIGIGKGTVTLEDFSRTDLILVVGQNPGTNHPRMLSALEQAKSNGSRLISINPLAEAGLSRFRNPQHFLNPLRALPTALGAGDPLADQHLPVKIGGDLALFKGFCKALVEWQEQGQNTVDLDFVRQKTEGYEALTEDLRASDWETLETNSGIAKESMLEVAQELAKTDRIIICWAMGLTQHTNSVDTITQVVNLLLLRGAIGKPGAGACPVRGHSNVQGDRTVGISHKPSSEFMSRLGEEFGFQAPTEQGYDVAECIEAMDEGKVDLFVSLGGNFLSASPDTAKTASGLAQCQLTVSIATKLNRSHLVTGREALILPCLGRTEVDRQNSGEQFVTVENSMGKVHRSLGALAPASAHLKSEVAIVTGIAERLDSATHWASYRDDYASIREAIERVIPGFEDYNRRILQKGGFYLPNGPREGRFTTPSGKAHFTVATLQHEALQSHELHLMTIRSHDQFNTVVYGYDDRYRGIKAGRRVVFVSEEDLLRLGFQGGQKVDVSSHYDGVERKVEGFHLVSYPIPPGCCAAYFPETNPLIPVSLRDPISGCPASKKIVVTLKRAD